MANKVNVGCILLRALQFSVYDTIIEKQSRKQGRKQWGGSYRTFYPPPPTLVYFLPFILFCRLEGRASFERVGGEGGGRHAACGCTMCSQVYLARRAV